MDNYFKYLLVSVGMFISASLISQTPCDAPNCDPVPMTDVCSDGTNTVTLTCDSGLTNVVWFNSSGVQVGTGCNLLVDNTLIGSGVVGDSECFYFEGLDANSCPGESCCPVNVEILNCMTCSIVGVDPTCNGFNDGSATVTPANGVAPFTYVWSNTQTTATASNLGAGPYTVTVTDAAGGTSTCDVILSQPPALTCTTTSIDLTCNGAGDGQASAAATGGVGPYTYLWDDPAAQTTAIATGLVAGTYTMVVTDANGCTTSCDAIVAEPSIITCTIVPTNPLCAGGMGGELDLTAAGGTGVLTFDWDNDGPEDPDDDTEDLVGLAAGTYTVTVTDANGCTTTCDATLVDPPALTCTSSATDATDCGIDDGTVTGVGSGGTGLYMYSLNGGAAQASGIFTGLSAGNYTITIIDANGCTVDCMATVDAPSAPMCTITNIVDVTCNGDSDGSLEAVGAGGSGSYEYSIDGTTFQPSGVFSGLVAGNYTITVRVAGAPSCTTTCNATISEPLLMTCNATATDVSCFGGADGTTTVVVTNGVGPFTYVWGTTPNQTSQTATSLLEGAYGVTVTDANGCTAACSVVVGGPPELTCSLDGTDLLCNGDLSGTVTVTASGGIMPWEYSINGGPFVTGNEFFGLPAGNHVVSTQDANGCVSVCMITLAEPDELTCNAVATDATDCAIDDGALMTTVVGGTGPYQYSLNGGPNGASGDFTNLGPGTYTVLVTDDNGCTTECMATVDAPITPMCTITSFTDASCNGVLDGSLTAAGAGGSGSFEYSLDGVVFQASGLFAGLAAGSYTVTVRNVGNPMCTSTCNVTISEPAELMCTTTVVDASCFEGADGEATGEVTGGTGPYTYLWDDSAAQTSEVAVNLTSGVYTLLVTDANGCTTTCQAIVAEATPVTCDIVVTDVSCNGDVGGILVANPIGGTAAYEYSLDGQPFQAGGVFQDLPAGSYIITIRDANVCIGNCTAIIEEPPVLTCTLTTTDATDCSVDDGTITVEALGGTATYEYSLNGGPFQPSNVFSALGGGTYMVEVMDANGCLTTCAGLINVPLAPMCNIISISDVSCNGLADGSLEAEGFDGSGVYEYSIDGVIFQTSGVFPNLPAGNYTITVRNQGQLMCLSTCSAIIVEPELLECSTDAIDALCAGSSEGSITVTTMGGTAPYTYLWSDPLAQTTATATGLAQSSYSVTVTDANGCTVECIDMIMDPAPVGCTLSSTDVSCNGGMDGVVVVTGSGGTSGYEFSLNGAPFQSVNVYSNLTAGTYIVTIRDANGCMSSCSITLTEPTLLTCSSVATDASDCGIDDGSIIADGADGSPGYEYSLNGGSFQTSGSFGMLMAGTYTVTVRDANGCTTECQATVNAPSVPMCNIIATTDITCNGGDDGSLTVEGMGGSGVFEFSLNGAAFTTATTFSNLTAGSYTVTVRNVGDAMCISTCNVTITEPEMLVCSTSGIDALCNGDANGSATVSALDGTAPYTYLWSDGQTTQTANNLAANTYMVTVTDANGCTEICNYTVNEPLVLSCTLDIVDNDCASAVPGSITVVVAGGTSLYEYSIDGGVTYQPGNAFNNLLPGSYTITVRDANACETTCAGEVLATNCDFDLALIKTISASTPGPYMPGGLVTFDITVVNQGSLDAFNVNVNDYIPTGLTLTDPAWIAAGGVATMVAPIASLTAGTQTVVPITFTIDPNFMGSLSLIHISEPTRPY